MAGGEHTGGKPEADAEAVSLALDMHARGGFKMAEIVAATGLSRATIYRRIADARGGDDSPGTGYEENATREPPASGGMVTAKGTGRICALPDYEHYSRRLEDVRGLQRKDVYAEYVAACDAAGERPYAFNTFSQGLAAWRRSFLISTEPEWRPGECMFTWWARMEAAGAPFWAFVAQMAFGDATFVCRSEGCSPRHWMASCERAFRFFGGVPHVTDCSVFGASRGGVTESARATLQGFAAHYRTVLFGARPKTGKTAERIEKPLGPKNSSAVLRAVRRELSAMAEFDADAVDAEIAKWVAFYNGTSFGGAPSRRGVLEERELPQMLALPVEPYDMATWDTRTLYHDHHFILHGARYSCPWQLAGQEVRICYTDDEVRAFHGGELVAVHAILPADFEGRRVSTDDAHRPPTHRWFAKRVERRFEDAAAEVGPNAVRAMKVMLAKCRHEGNGFRACKELVDLRHAPSAVGLDEACRLALASRGPIDVETVRSYIAGS